MSSFHAVIALRHDEQAGTLVTLPQRQHEEPTTLTESLHVIKSMSMAAAVPERIIDQLTRPLALNLPDVARYRTADKPVPVIMAPTPGHLLTHYDLADPRHAGVLVHNQMVAASWELTRHILTSLGAQVIVAKSVMPSGLPMEPEVQTPVEEMFTRDAGFVWDKKFITTSPGAHTGFLASFMSEAASGDGQLLKDRLKPIAGLVAAYKQSQIKHIVAAYREAGLALTHRPVDAFLEGGDIAPDPDKGVIFVGREIRQTSRVAALNEERLKEALKRETGAAIIPVERHHAVLNGEGGFSVAPRFHIDTLGKRLSLGDLMTDPRYTTPQTLDRMRHVYGSKLLIIGSDNPDTVAGPVGYGGRVPNYVANSVMLGQTLVMPSCSDSLQHDLKERGYTVVAAKEHGVPPGRFYMRGGGMNCVTQTPT